MTVLNKGLVWLLVKLRLIPERPWDPNFHLRKRLGTFPGGLLLVELGADHYTKLRDDYHSIVADAEATDREKIDAVLGLQTLALAFSLRDRFGRYPYSPYSFDQQAELYGIPESLKEPAIEIIREGSKLRYLFPTQEDREKREAQLQEEGEPPEFENQEDPENP